MIINILKCHGSSNDFILIDEYNNSYNFSDEQRVILSKTLCNRSSSLGADGILFFTKSEKADAGMRIFNTDGSEAEMCGNGLRCIGRYALELFNKDTLTIETLKDNLQVKKLPDIVDGVKTVEVTIKPVWFEVEKLPLNYHKKNLKNQKLESLSKKLHFTALSVPNPHIVTIVDNIDEDEIEIIGKKANSDKNLFPKGVNLNFVKILGPNKIFVQTYERGVGLTNACGTGMSSSALVTCLLGINKIGSVINVINRGGMVKCQPQINEAGKYTISLMGNATYVFEGEVDFDFQSPSEFKYTNKYDFIEECDDYDKLTDDAMMLLNS